MKLLRQENAVLEFRGAKFNLIGVDYQRERNLNGHRTQMLSNMEPAHPPRYPQYFAVAQSQ